MWTSFASTVWTCSIGSWIVNFFWTLCDGIFTSTTYVYKSSCVFKSILSFLLSVVVSVSVPSVVELASTTFKTASFKVLNEATNLTLSSSVASSFKLSDAASCAEESTLFSFASATNLAIDAFISATEASLEIVISTPLLVVSVVAVVSVLVVSVVAAVVSSDLTAPGSGKSIPPFSSCKYTDLWIEGSLGLSGILTVASSVTTSGLPGCFGLSVVPFATFFITCPSLAPFSTTVVIWNKTRFCVPVLPRKK